MCCVSSSSVENPSVQNISFERKGYFPEYIMPNISFERNGYFPEYIMPNISFERKGYFPKSLYEILKEKENISEEVIE
jgi:hypothetical protein